MGYGNKIYLKALDELRNRRMAAESHANMFLGQFHNECPRAREIISEMATASTRIARAIFSGEDSKRLLEELQQQNLGLQMEYGELLIEKGFTTNDITPQYECKKCDDTGFIDGKMCSCLINLQKKLAYSSLNMEVPLENSTFDAFDLNYYEDEKSQSNMSYILKYCMSYASGFNLDSQSLLFTGTTGLGKTHLSLAIAQAAIDKGFGVVYASVQNMAVTLERERFGKFDQGETDTISHLSNCDLLILDDLGIEFSSQYVTSLLYDIINTRIMAKRPTIISTNLTFEELEKRYSMRFVSRLAGYFNLFTFSGKDVRFLKRRRKT